MYRFLDKRFYRRSRLDFDLRTLACEHIGLSRSYAPTELKRRLKPALEEMEQLGFLEPLRLDERYSYVKRGCWRIIFIRGRRAAAEVQDPIAEREHQPALLIQALKARGVTSKTAQELVDAHPPGRIHTKIEVFDWLMHNEDKRVGKNPAGYLVASIRSDYQVPGDYQARASSVRPAGGGPGGSKTRTHGDPVARKGKLAEEVERPSVTKPAKPDSVREWERLPEAEREAILASVKVENPGLGRWKNMLEPLCLSELETRLIVNSSEVGQRLLFPDVEPAL